MTLPRFFLGLMLILISLVSFKYINAPILRSNMPILFGEAVGGIMGGLLLGIIIWIPVRLIQGDERAPNIRSFTLYTAFISVTILTSLKFIQSTTLTQNERIEFALGSKNSCFSSQRSSPENSGLSDSQLNEFCSCFSSSISKIVTKNEIVTISSKKLMPDSLQIKRNKVSEKCSNELIEKWKK